MRKAILYYNHSNMPKAVFEDQMKAYLKMLQDWWPEVKFLVLPVRDQKTELVFIE